MQGRCVAERWRSLAEIRDKYQRLLVNIEALNISLAEEMPQYDEKSLKDAIDQIFAIASDLAEDLRAFKVD